MFHLFADAAAQAAPAAGNAAAAKGQGGLMSFLPIILIMVVFMFFMSRSQKKQQQKRQEMLDHIVKGTKVTLASGICGVIDEVRFQRCRSDSLECAPAGFCRAGCQMRRFFQCPVAI